MTSIRSARPQHVFTAPIVRRLLLATSVLFLAAIAAPRAQDPQVPSDDIPAHLAIVDGNATLERDATAEPAQANVPLLAGDRLRTDRGRAEVLFGDGSALDLDEYTTVEFASDALMRLQAGRVRLSAARGADAIDYRIDAAASSVQIRTAGEYRVAVTDPRSNDPQVIVDVLLGSAELSNPLGRTLVRAGMRSAATPRTEPSAPTVAYPTDDEFDRWSEDQRDARTGTASTRYLPDDLQYYGGSLDRSGSWGYEADYGEVWYPRVASTWQPYYDGRWDYYGSLGWTWVGSESWSWPTHHFGRWGYRQSRWFWVPDRRWGPAWVSWAYAPGYVSWCPLGFDNRAIFDIGISFGTRNFDGRFGWNVIPSRAFVPRVSVARYVVARPSLNTAVWSQFVRRDSGPVWNATSYSAAPLRSPRATSGRSALRGSPVGGSAPRDWSAQSGGSRRLDSRGAPLNSPSRPALTQPRTAPADGRTRGSIGTSPDRTSSGQATGRIYGQRDPQPVPGRAYGQRQPETTSPSRTYGTTTRQPEVTAPSRTYSSGPRQPQTTAPGRAYGYSQRQPETAPGRTYGQRQPEVTPQAPPRTYSTDRGQIGRGQAPSAQEYRQPSRQAQPEMRNEPRGTGGGQPAAHPAPPASRAAPPSASGGSGGGGRQAPSGSDRRGTSGRRGGGR